MKKKNILYFACALAMSALCSCDDFLDKEPQDQQTNATYWQTEKSLRTYAQDFYSYFYSGYATDYTAFGGYFSGDDYTDDFLTLAGGKMYFSVTNRTEWNGVTSSWTNNYNVVYKANVMIEKIPGMKISDEAKAHWMGVARYFRAMAYSAMAKFYGGVPYYEQATDPANPELYKDRDTYEFVAKKILEDFQYALDNVRTDDTKRQVNKYVVGAYMSRELLFHATWMKYHKGSVVFKENVGDDVIKSLLDGAIKGAQVVMNSGKFKVGSTYNLLFATDDLWNNPEIIWYREYDSKVQCNALISYNGPEDMTMGSVTQNVIDSYLCSDGLPIGQSPLYQGKNDPSIWNVFADRDPRLYQTVADSARVMTANGVAYNEGASPTGYPTKKFLNDSWWAANSDYCRNRQSPADAPCIRFAEVLLNYAEARYEIATVGGKAFEQADLDLSINLLRSRQLTKWGDTEAKTMPAMKLAGNSIAAGDVTINDPARDQDVSAILWEIRRERRVELVMEGRRGEDLRRWAKFEYLNSEDANGNPTMPFLGAWINLADYPKMKAEDEKGNRTLRLFNPEDPTNGLSDKGYIEYLYAERTSATQPIRKFVKGQLDSERHYRRAIPVGQITIYEDKGFKLTQNPGWEN